MLQYWASAVVDAHKLTWETLFGSLRRVIIDSSFFLLAVAVLYYAGRRPQMTEQLSWLQAILIAAAVMYVPMLVFNVFRVPHLRDQTASKEIDRLKQLAGEVNHAPSFDLGFELVELDLERIQSFNTFNIESSIVKFDAQEVCRVWVENLGNHAITDCRIIIESFGPKSPIKNGVMLIVDNRGSDKGEPAQFDLAATERRYFKFLRLQQPFLSGELAIVVESDQNRTGVEALFDDLPKLEFGKRYFATIAVHGRNANSRRINLIIDAISETKIVILENSSSNERAPVG
jgi:hypothetical protein